MFVVFFLLAIAGGADAALTADKATTVFQQQISVFVGISATLSLIAGVMDLWGWVIAHHVKEISRLDYDIKTRLDALPQKIATAIVDEMESRRH